jgi:hypothetical protein
VQAEAKLERILGADWETLTQEQVKARAFELERVTNFLWVLSASMSEHHAATVGAVLQPAHSMREREAPTAGAVLLAHANGDEPPR